MTSSFPMKKNTATKIVFPILDADGDPVTGAAGLDSEYSLDGGAFADCASEATEISGGIYYLNLASGETNGDVVCIQVKTSTSGAKTTVLVFYTATQTLDETDAICDAIKAKTDNLPADPADDSDIDSQLSTISSKIDAVDDYVDTEVAAIKAKTDLIPADIATQLDTNIPAIKAKTDNLPSDPADESNLTALITTVDTVVDAIKLKTDNLPSDPADQSLLEAEINANEAKIDTIDTIVDAIKAKTDTIPINPATEAKQDTIITYIDTEVAAIKAVTDTLSLTAIADSVLDEVVDANNPANTNSLREVINVISAALAGKSSGGGTNTIKFRDLGDTKDRINATVTAVGDRTAVTQDGT